MYVGLYYYTFSKYLHKSVRAKQDHKKLFATDLTSYSPYSQFSGLAAKSPVATVLGRRTILTGGIGSIHKYCNYYLAVTLFLMNFHESFPPQLPNPHLSIDTLDCPHEIEGLKYKNVLCYSLWKH